jgi:acyl carrier protein
MDHLEIRALIADHLGVHPSAVTDEAHFQRDLGADSLDLVELTMRLECALGIDISDDESEQCLNVADALACIGRKSQTRAQPGQVPAPGPVPISP